MFLSVVAKPSISKSVEKKYFAVLKIEYFSIELSVPSYLIQHIILDGMFCMLNFAILWDAYIVKEILLF